MSKEKLLISLLKSEQSIAELRRSKDNSTEIEETKRILNELRNRFSKKKKKRKKKRKNFRFREEIDKYLKELEGKNSLAEQGNERKNITPEN